MTSNSDNPLSVNALRLYYSATAVFLLLDYAFGINIRLASLDAFPGWRAFYYGICFLCLGLMFWRPAWSTWVATSESLVTLSMLIITMGARVMNITDSMLSTGAGIVTTEEIINFLIAGGAAFIAYTRGTLAIQKQLRRH
ncbi:MAG: hypothetical protein O3A13_03550 [Proteobacteria bacterium]|nr:hypothetical protein [Pseudomonadota bacterium]MDA0992689.1 hypothetical protein [Pseudomonadota bacterium]